MNVVYRTEETDRWKKRRKTTVAIPTSGNPASHVKANNESDRGDANKEPGGRAATRRTNESNCSDMSKNY